MRLIEADALLFNLEIVPLTDDGGVDANDLDDIIKRQPTVDAVPVQYILTTIREWNRDGYAESAEALEILVMNWDKEKTEWAERRTDGSD